jgi:hypothetical protein
VAVGDDFQPRIRYRLVARHPRTDASEQPPKFPKQSAAAATADRRPTATDRRPTGNPNRTASGSTPRIPSPREDFTLFSREFNLGQSLERSTVSFFVRKKLSVLYIYFNKLY